MVIAQERRRRSLRHSFLLLAAMGAVLAFCGWIIAGWEGVGWSLFAAALTLYLARQLPPAIVLRAVAARPVAPAQAPALYRILDDLCRRAGIETSPRISWVGNGFPAAFTLGDGGAATIVLSEGLVREMSVREIRGILAHELVHVRNGDLALMRLAMVVGRVTRLLAQVAFMLVFFDLFLRAVSAPGIPFVPLVLLALAPSAVGLLQLALSREREGEADLEAAELTGDPYGLASALLKIRRRERMLLRGRFPGARVLRVPALLRDHPATEQRIRRLLALPRPGDDSDDDDRPALTPRDHLPPRWDC